MSAARYMRPSIRDELGILIHDRDIGEQSVRTTSPVDSSGGDASTDAGTNQ